MNLEGLLLDAKSSLRNGCAALGTGNALIEEQRMLQRAYSWMFRELQSLRSLTPCTEVAPDTVG